MSTNSNVLSKKTQPLTDPNGFPIASHEGKFRLGEMLVSCAVLRDKRRIIKQSSFLRALGRPPFAKGGEGISKTPDQNPSFLRSKALIPFITKELITSTAPVRYVTKNGKEFIGYDAASLPDVAEVYLKLRDQCAYLGKEIPRQMQHLVLADDVLIRGLSKVGVIALVDECTGFQDIRERDALQTFLELFISKELLPWVKRFPMDFFKSYKRLYGLSEDKGAPQHIGHFINTHIYKKLGTGVLEELKKRNPKVEDLGKRAYTHHQFLTLDLGCPALEKQIIKTLTMMEVSNTKEEFDLNMKKMEERSLAKS